MTRRRRTFNCPKAGSITRMGQRLLVRGAGRNAPPPAQGYAGGGDRGMDGSVCSHIMPEVPAMTDSALDRARRYQAELTAIRHDIHANPELGLEEFRTSELVARKLEEWGIEVHRGVGIT